MLLSKKISSWIHRHLRKNPGMPAYSIIDPFIHPSIYSSNHSKMHSITPWLIQKFYDLLNYSFIHPFIRIFKHLISLNKLLFLIECFHWFLWKETHHPLQAMCICIQRCSHLICAEIQTGLKQNVFSPQKCSQQKQLHFWQKICNLWNNILAPTTCILSNVQSINVILYPCPFSLSLPLFGVCAGQFTKKILSTSIISLSHPGL